MGGLAEAKPTLRWRPVNRQASKEVPLFHSAVAMITTPCVTLYVAIKIPVGPRVIRSSVNVPLSKLYPSNAGRLFVLNYSAWVLRVPV